MSIKRAILVTVGCMTLGLGCVGIVLPILPIVPFFLITRYCFSASNERLHRWFIGTKLYKCAVNIVRNTKKKRDFPQRESLLLVNHSEAKPGSNQVLSEQITYPQFSAPIIVNQQLRQRICA